MSTTQFNLPPPQPGERVFRGAKATLVAAAMAAGDTLYAFADEFGDGLMRIHGDHAYVAVSLAGYEDCYLVAKGPKSFVRHGLRHLGFIRDSAVGRLRDAFYAEVDIEFLSQAEADERLGWDGKDPK